MHSFAVVQLVIFVRPRLCLVTSYVGVPGGKGGAAGHTHISVPRVGGGLPSTRPQL